MSDTRTAIINAALAMFPAGHDEYGIYTQWKEQLDKALEPFPAPEQYFDQLADKIAEKLRAREPWVQIGEGIPLPEEGKPVFFMTASGHWAGERHGDAWCDWGEKGEICDTAAVIQWQYAPQVVTVPLKVLAGGIDG